MYFNIFNYLQRNKTFFSFLLILKNFTYITLFKFYYYSYLCYVLLKKKDKKILERHFSELGKWRHKHGFIVMFFILLV